MAKQPKPPTIVITQGKKTTVYVPLPPKTKKS
jgi:hypothetical protein